MTICKSNSKQTPIAHSITLHFSFGSKNKNENESLRSWFFKCLKFTKIWNAVVTHDIILWIFRNELWCQWKTTYFSNWNDVEWMERRKNEIIEKQKREKTQKFVVTISFKIHLRKQCVVVLISTHGMTKWYRNYSREEKNTFFYIRHILW